MSIFIDGRDIEYTFMTSSGLIDMIAGVAIHGSTLELKDPSVYSGDGSMIHAGVKQMLEITREIVTLATL